ncbi:VIT1/CCC1 transporter family protein [Mucilaginibacter sp. KACC 22063]|uniref:VIT1/CCC1 transporter family protein n=1 Tax=Mucilaginibacter sp. KACC 22063 TaxID=3025666 RepID=UPI002365EDC8|nr:VIT family protein [Mucilaginibacter sp. KACC 22063]WDF54690.1 VIT family protein [Mucilaginibacter sp. KACC 22063]
MNNNDNERHFINRVGWLRAGVLGANDGILSTTSLVIGVAAATHERNTIILTALSGLIAGAMSMAAGEYVSVSSQEETEKADIQREKAELRDMPEEELKELTLIYKNRGLSDELASQVAIALTEHDALEAHLRDELGMTEISAAKPLQAALASFASFLVGALLPLIVSIFAPLPGMIVWQYTGSIIFLMMLGAVAARTGGSPIWAGVLKICFWGTIAMATTALIGYLFGTHIA